MQKPFQALLKGSFLLKDVANVSQPIVVPTTAEGRRRRTGESRKLRKVEHNNLNGFILTAVKNML